MYKAHRLVAGTLKAGPIAGFHRAIVNSIPNELCTFDRDWVFLELADFILENALYPTKGLSPKDTSNESPMN